jgi:chaperonin GroES
VIKRIDAEAKIASGIIIPDNAKEKPQQGEVVAAGPGRRDESGKLIPVDVKVHDRVLFGKWSGTDVKIDDVEYLIMNESDIMGCAGRSRSAQESCVRTLVWFRADRSSRLRMSPRIFEGNKRHVRQAS